MSKQYLTTHTIDDAHPTDVFALAVTSTQILSASGSSDIKIYSTASSDYPFLQTLSSAHKLGCHHLCTSTNGKKAASIGFAGEIRLWRLDDNPDDGRKNEWQGDGVINSKIAGEIWAIALSENGQYLAGTSVDGRIGVWDVFNESKEKIQEYETKGSFGMCIDLSVDGRYTASGHENGSIYIFSNDNGRLAHSLPGLINPVRAVSFSPGVKLLAAAGDAKTIALYEVESGERIALLTGHVSWIFTLDWNDSGEYLLSGSFDGKAKIWSIDTRQCVATHSESDKAIWAAKWLPKTGRSESFAIAGANGSISFYREASGGS